MRGVRLTGSWILALFLSAMFLWIADLTLFPRESAANAVFPALAQASGLRLWEPTGRLAVGLLQVFAALLIFIPLTRKAGAIVGFLVAGGAVASHLLWLGSSAPLEVGSVARDAGQLLYLALALLAGSLLLFFIHPPKT